ncbi:MAG: aminopeptidase [Patescibacteria group bacterium]
MPYIPNKKILERYADVLVNFAPNSGKGVKKGEVIQVVASECAKPLYAEILKAIIKAGGHFISKYAPDDDKKFNISRDFYLNAKEHQLNFFPAKYYRGLVDQMDHQIMILSETDMESLKGIDSKKIIERGKSIKPYREWRNEKENKGKFTWVLALYGTPAMAKEAGLSEKEYWRQIIDACFLNYPNPVAKWREIGRQIDRTKDKLNRMPIDKLHITGPDADLWITLGEKRLWEGGRGRNIPSFEIFTSPDWRGTNGWIRFNQPVYTYGQLIKGVKLKFKKGLVVEAKAKQNEKLLKQLISAPGGNRIGEYSLTDKRFSRITKFMAETLFDENIGGPNGNTHLAVGASYHDCYRGDPSKPKKSDWVRLGFNDSAIHQDMISTTPRMVTAHLKNGRAKMIYRNGMFAI